MEKKIYVLIGASGSGKTTLGKHLKIIGMNEIVSHTTREPREGEVFGVDYYFVDKHTFDKELKIEQTCYAGNYYGMSKREVDEKLAKYDRVFAITDIVGVETLKSHYGDKVVVIQIKTPIHLMIDRMIHRNDHWKKILKRVWHYILNKEYATHSGAYVIKNIELEKAIQELEKIIM